MQGEVVRAHKDGLYVSLDAGVIAADLSCCVITCSAFMITSDWPDAANGAAAHICDTIKASSAARQYAGFAAAYCRYDGFSVLQPPRHRYSLAPGPVKMPGDIHDRSSAERLRANAEDGCNW
jgi:hypothetical protein